MDLLAATTWILAGAPVRRCAGIGLLLLSACASMPPRAGDAAPAAQRSDALIVADFGAGVTTAQGGFFGVTGGKPDCVRDDLAEIGQPAARAWRITAAAGAAPTGVGGYVPLFDNSSDATVRRPLDISATPFIELRLLGVLGGRALRIEVNPTTVIDAGAAGTLVAELDAGKLSPERWQTLRFRVPAATAGVIRLMLAGDGPAWVALDRVRFCASLEPTEWPLTPPGATHSLRLATWVWSSQMNLAEREQADRLLEFCRGQHLTDVFLQVPYEFHDGAVTLKLVDSLRAFNSAAHAAQIRVHALDGAPEYVLRKNHPRMYALVDALQEYNRGGLPDARFDALHIDNEPYILPEWKDPNQRPLVIDGYLALYRELRRRANAADLELGTDIPFWFGRRDADGQPAFPVQTSAGTITLLEALLPVVQSVGVMSYRERVTGPNGVVAVCQDEFSLGQKYGVAVFTSIELGTGPRVEQGITLGCYSRDYFADQYAMLRHVLACEPGCAGLAIHSYASFRRMEDG